MVGEGRDAEDHAVPRLRLDELLDELQIRVDEVRGTRDHLNGLLKAVMAVGRELDLSQVLHGIVEAAVALVDAEYGALGVIGEDHRLAAFLPVGVSDEARAQIGQLPSGHGILGLLIQDPQPLRLSEIADHPAAFGFPAHHPPMHSFLGVPIRVREEVFGNLYLTQKRGGGEFDAQDEAVLSTLAVAAGIAIENARLFEEVRLRERWQAASSDFTSALLSGSDERVVLKGMLERARELAAAELAVFHLLGDGAAVRDSLAAGEGAQSHESAPPANTGGTLIEDALAVHGPLVVPDIAQDPRAPARAERWAGFGPAVILTVDTEQKRSGVLVLARRAGRQPFTAVERAALAEFARQAALALNSPNAVARQSS